MRLTVISLSIALLISIAANVCIFRQGKDFYLRLNAVRLDPLGLACYPATASQQNTVPSDRRTVVFFGTSRANHWTVPSGLASFRFINRGIDNQTSAQVRGRFDYHVSSLKPDMIILVVGGNDLKTIPLFPHRKESIIENCKSNIAELVSESLDIGATVVLPTIFPTGEIPLTRRPFWSTGEVAGAGEEVNAFLYSLERENVIVFDTIPILVNESGFVKKEYSRDFLHLTKAGYDALNAGLIPVLKNWALYRREK